MKITTNSPQAQAYFNQGLRLLHCFWYFEAYRAFKEAARLDPSAAMAYWGIAQTLGAVPSMEPEQKAAIRKAKALLGQVSDHERCYIRATDSLIENPGEKGQQAYISELEALISKYPDDLNAQAFLALFKMAGFASNGQPNPGEIYSQMLLRYILAIDPDNAAANHYWIHAVEGGPHPERALKSAELVPRLAPRSGHMVHMAGHIYYRLGDYEKARQAFLNSMHVDLAYMSSLHISPEDDASYGHNLSYLVAACAEAGRYDEGLKWAKGLVGLKASPLYGKDRSFYVVRVGSSQMLLDIRFGRWDRALNDPVEFGVNADQVSATAKDYVQGLRSYAAGMRALAGGSGIPEIQKARNEVESLQALLWRLNEHNPTGKPGDSDWSTKAISILKVAALDLQGNLQSAAGNSAEAFSTLKDAITKEKKLGYSEPPIYARPVEESLGDAYLRARKWNLARQAFRQELQLRPQSGFALYGIARSYKLEGDTANARQAYQQFVAAWRSADRDLLQIQKARAWLKQHQH